MALFRVIVCFILLFLLTAHLTQAQAGLLPSQSTQEAAILSIRNPSYGGRCPHLCVQWFDGCNNCTCNRSGRLDVCTQQYCFWRGRPRCLRWGF